MLDYYLNVNKKFNLFQGFIECNENKVPIKGTYFGNHKQATDSSENIQGILNEGIVLIDIDTATEGELYLNYLKKCNVNTLIVKTTRGYHFYFKSNDIIKNTTHNLSILGITFDIKNSNGGKLSTATIKVNNKFREIIDEPTTELPKLPFYFEYAILNRNDFYKEKLTNVLTATDGSYLNTEFIDLCKKYKYKYIDKSFNFLNKHFFNNSIERIVDIDNIFNDSIKNTNFSNNTKFISNINKPSLIDYASKVLTQSKNGFYECPFCGSGRGAHRTGAFKVYTDTNKFYCFSCHKSGDFYTLYMYLNNVDFKTAYNTFNKKTFDNKFLLLKNFRFSNYDYFLLWIHSLLTCNSQLLLKYNLIKTDNIQPTENSIITTDTTEFIDNLKLLTYKNNLIYHSINNTINDNNLNIIYTNKKIDYIQEGSNNNYDFARDIKLLKPREYNQKYNLYRDYVFKPTEYKDFYESNDYRIIFNPNLNILYESVNKISMENITFKTNTFINSEGEESDYSIKLSTCNFADYLNLQGLDTYNHKALHRINMLFSFERIGNYFISKDKTILYNPLNNTYVDNFIKFDKYTHFDNEEMPDDGINLMLKNGFYYDNQIYFLFNPELQIKLNYDDFRDYDKAKEYIENNCFIKESWAKGFYFNKDFTKAYNPQRRSYVKFDINKTDLNGYLPYNVNNYNLDKYESKKQLFIRDKKLFNVYYNFEEDLEKKLNEGALICKYNLYKDKNNNFTIRKIDKNLYICNEKYYFNPQKNIVSFIGYSDKMQPNSIYYRDRREFRPIDNPYYIAFAKTKKVFLPYKTDNKFINNLLKQGFLVSRDKTILYNPTNKVQLDFNYYSNHEWTETF